MIIGTLSAQGSLIRPGCHFCPLDVIERPESGDLILDRKHLGIHAGIHAVDVHVIPRIQSSGKPLTQVQTNDTEEVNLVTIKIRIQQGDDSGAQCHCLIIKIMFDRPYCHHHERAVVNSTFRIERNFYTANVSQLCHYSIGWTMSSGQAPFDRYMICSALPIKGLTSC